MKMLLSTSFGNASRKTRSISRFLFLAFAISFLHTHTSFAQIAQNPLMINVTISATVLVNGTAHPDTPPSPSPGPVNMRDTVDVAIFRGLAYPGSIVSILKNGLVLANVPANSDGTFDLRLRDVMPGTYSFSLRAEDSSHLTSRLVTFSVFISSGIATTIDGIIIPPTITSDKVEVKKGEKIIFSGSAAPGAEVRLSLTTSLIEIVKKIQSNASGTWSYDMDSSSLAFGDFQAKARSVLSDNISLYSDPLLFKVSDTTKWRTKATLAGFRKKCDLNDDSRVNLLDFSIMAFWYKRLGFPLKVDLNSDNYINLTDLSILAYCWTG